MKVTSVESYQLDICGTVYIHFLCCSARNSTEEMCYALYFENQEMIYFPNALIACPIKFKLEDEPSSSKQHQQNCSVPKRAVNCHA